MYGIQEKMEKVGKFPESGDIIRMEYFRKNPEKKVCQADAWERSGL